MQEKEPAKQSREAVTEIVGKHTPVKDQTTVRVYPDPTNNGRVSMAFLNIPGRDNFTMSIPALQATQLASNLRQAAHAVLGIYGTKEQFKGGKRKHAIKETKRARRARQAAEEQRQLLDKVTEAVAAPVSPPHVESQPPSGPLTGDDMGAEENGIYKFPGTK